MCLFKIFNLNDLVFVSEFHIADERASAAKEAKSLVLLHEIEKVYGESV